MDVKMKVLSFFYNVFKFDVNNSLYFTVFGFLQYLVHVGKHCFREVERDLH